MPNTSPVAATEPDRVEPERSLGLALLAASICVGAALRAWLSFNDDGIYWPDEIYQSLEPAHRLVFGYGLISWEYLQGARNWSLPGVVAGVLKLSASFGAGEPRSYLYVVRLFFSAIGVATAYASYRLARSQGASAFAAAFAAALFSLAAPAIYFGPRAMSETASALPVALGFALSLGRNASRASRVLGASLLGAAVLLRLQNGIFCLGLLSILMLRKDWRWALEALAVLALWAFLFGLLDKLTWGEWFQSALAYIRANVLERKSEQWGTAAVTYYARVLWRSMPVPAVLMLGLSLFAASRALGLFLIAVAFLLSHSLIPHKELRFILPVFPILCSLAAVGLSVLQQRFRSGVSTPVAAALVISSAVSALRFHQLTFGELGQYEDLKPGASAYDDFGGLNRLLLAAHARADLCGLKVEIVHLAWTGGFTYLHRPLPLYPNFGPPRESGFYNYVITFLGLAPQNQIVASEGNLALVRLARPTCVKDSGYQWLLP